MISRLGARVPATEKQIGRPGDIKSFPPPSSLGHHCPYLFLSIHHDRYRLGLPVRPTFQLEARVPATEWYLGRPVNKKYFLPCSLLGLLHLGDFESIHHVLFRFHSLLLEQLENLRTPEFAGRERPSLYR
jgi:hypothetical protein